MGTPISLNYPGWSISVEMFFYAIFPFALALARDSRFRPRVLLVASLAAWAMTQVVVVYLVNARVTLATHGSLHDLLYYFPVVHLCSFLLGVTGGAWYLTEGQARRRSRLTTSLLAMASLAVSYLALEYQDKWNVIDGVYIPTSASFMSPLFLWVVLALARAEGPVARFFSRKPFVLLGEASFAFYILEVPVDALYMRYLLPGRPNRGFDWSPGHFLRFVGILLVVAIASVYLFERPVRRFMMRLIPKTGPTGLRPDPVATPWTGDAEVAVAGVSSASLVDSAAERG
jgi:peptidoglycan/LPS O-acetylase OafA/YrhL